MGVIVAWLVCGVGWVGVYTIPNQFESSARLFVDADAILTPLLRGLAADLRADHATRDPAAHPAQPPNMEKLISKTDLDLTLNSPSDRERLLARLSAEIKVTPQTKNLFTITYRDKKPKLAHDVVQTLLTIFIESATGGSRADMENARRFLERQIQSYEQQLRGRGTAAGRFSCPLHRDPAVGQQSRTFRPWKARASSSSSWRAGCRTRCSRVMR